MRHLVIFILISCFLSCSEDDSIEKIKTIGQINDEVAFLDIEKVNGDSIGFVFELQSHNQFKYLSVTDRGLICDTLSTVNCLGWHSAYLQHFISPNDLTPSRTSGRRLWYKISGDVLPPNPQKELIGNPFVLTSLEKILSCPVAYQVVTGQIPLNETGWKLLGFVDDNGTIYSHPACESNNVVLKFTSVSLDNYPLNLPDGKMIELNTGNYLTYQMNGQIPSYSIIDESDQIRIRYLSSPYFIPGVRNNVRHDGPRTRETINKSDSLLRLLGGNDTLDFVLENNILKLNNSRTKLKAMFVAN